MSLDKLKVAARQHEQRDEWRSAIDLYRQAIHKAEGGEHGVDPSLYNRIGDLEQREGHDQAACEAWEQAAARYGEQGFFNNAIALCGKILRLDPSRVRSYLELARFQARKKVIYEVRQNLEQYLAHMQHRGESDQAAVDLERLAADFPGWRELGKAVNELLGREVEPEDVDQGGPGDRASGLIFLDTDSQRGQGTSTPAAGSADSSGELVLEPTAVADDEFEAEPTAIDGLERASEEFVDLPDSAPGTNDDGHVAGLTGFEVTAEAVGSTVQIDGLEGPAMDSEASHAAADTTITIDGLESTSSQTRRPSPDEIPEVGLEPIGSPAADGIVFLDTDAAPAPVAVSTEPGEGGPETDAPLEHDTPLAVRADAHELLDQGDRQGAVEALERSMAGYLEAEQFDRAFQVATELIEAQPAAVDRYQARVEIAVRMRDPARLCTAYMDLAGTLVRLGAHEKAVAVYRRVLEIDDSHAGAKAALRQMVPEAAPEETADGFIDFGAMVNDDIGPRSSRMRTETTTISDDEDETFREALAEFKRALDQNIAVEDHQAHYDLGLAFKGMGLLDEAIGELQKALRSNEGRLRTSEALGECFFEQGRPAVAEAVLRSVDKGEESDAEKIGVLYWLGRALEAQGKTKNSRNCYERVLAIDIGFHDVADRITALNDGTG